MPRPGRGWPSCMHGIQKMVSAYVLPAGYMEYRRWSVHMSNQLDTWNTEDGQCICPTSCYSYLFNKYIVDSVSVQPSGYMEYRRWSVYMYNQLLLFICSTSTSVDSVSVQPSGYMEYRRWLVHLFNQSREGEG